MERKAFILGATSSLAVALCHGLAGRGFELLLSARDKEELELLAEDIRIRYGVKVSTFPADIASPKFSASALLKKTGHCDAAFFLAGDMGTEDKNDLENIEHVTRVNYTGPSQLITLVAKAMEARTGGSIVVVSSVAGERGRQSNYIYGSAKAALTSFASGLRNRYARSNVHILTVKPGFIDTPMTYALNSPLTASRNGAASAILKAMERKRDVVYIPFFWRYILCIIKAIPEPIFKRLKL